MVSRQQISPDVVQILLLLLLPYLRGRFRFILLSSSPLRRFLPPGIMSCFPFCLWRSGGGRRAARLGGFEFIPRRSGDGVLQPIPVLVIRRVLCIGTPSIREYLCERLCVGATVQTYATILWKLQAIILRWLSRGRASKSSLGLVRQTIESKKTKPTIKKGKGRAGREGGQGQDSMARGRRTNAFPPLDMTLPAARAPCFAILAAESKTENQRTEKKGKEGSNE